MYLLNEDEEEASAWSWGNPEMEDTVPISVKNFPFPLGLTSDEDDSDFTMNVLYVIAGAVAFYLWLRPKIREGSSSFSAKGTVIFVCRMVVIFTLRCQLQCKLTSCT
jgi:hypothetical protein